MSCSHCITDYDRVRPCRQCRASAASEVIGQIDPRIEAKFNATHDFRLADHLLVLGYVGSTSHNTYVPKDDPDCIDDIDLMGVVAPPIEYVLGLKTFEHWTLQFEELDVVLYSLEKYVSLLIKSNPNVMGLLWLRPEHYVYRRREWNRLHESRRAFSSRVAERSFAGYAAAQLHKMTAFDLQAQADWDRVNSILDRAGWTVEQIVTDAHTEMPLDASLTKEELFWARQVGQKIHARHFQGYMGAKRKALVKKHGYDSKNAAHLVRLLRMAVEFLSTGELQVYRTHDAQELRDIKSGKWSLERVKETAEALFADVRRTLETSPLPERVDAERISDLMVRLQLSTLKLSQHG